MILFPVSMLLLSCLVFLLAFIRINNFIKLQTSMNDLIIKKFMEQGQINLQVAEKLYPNSEVLSAYKEAWKNDKNQN